jgi:type II secretory pathway pseudopilin PulG
MMPGLYIKLGIGLAIVALITSAFFYVKGMGYDERDQEVQAQLAEQIVKSATDMYLQMDRSEQAVRRLSDKMTELNNDRYEAKQEALRYANSPAKKCVVSPELHQSFDRIAKLYDRPMPPVDQQAPSEGPVVHDAEGGQPAIHDGGVRGADEERAGPLTDAVLNFAVQNLTGRLAQCVETKNALIDWEDERYDLELKASGRQLIKEQP